MHKPRLVVLPHAYWALSVGLLLLPLKLVIAWIISVFVHELFHYIALKICGIQVFAIKIGLWGTKMETESLSNGEEIFCAIAGPIGGFCLLVFVRIFPLLAVLGCLHSIYNLIPIFPLDGGRVIHCIISRYTSKSEIIKIWYDRVVILVLLLLSIILSLRLSLGLMPIVLVAIIAFRNGKKIFLQT